MKCRRAQPPCPTRGLCMTLFVFSCLRWPFNWWPLRKVVKGFPVVSIFGGSYIDIHVPYSTLLSLAGVFYLQGFDL